MNARQLFGRLRVPRDGRASVTLEGFLTGVSVWLASSLLLNDQAEASSWSPSPLPGAATGEGGSAGAGGVAPPRPMRGAQRSAPRRPTDGASTMGNLADASQEESGPDLASKGDGASSRRRPPLGGEGPQVPLHRPTALLPAPPALGVAPEASAAGGGFGGGGVTPLAFAAASGPATSDSDGAEASPVSAAIAAPAIDTDPAPDLPPAPAPSAPIARVPSSPLPPQISPPPRVSVVAVVGEETVVARSFSGPAVVRARSSQVALEGTTIDGREGTTEWMEVVSSRRLHSLATSTLGAAELDVDGETIGARQAQLWAGDSIRSIRIEGLDDLHFALAGAAPSTAQIRQQTIAMENSTLRADAGVDTLSVRSLMDLDVDLQGHPDQAGLSLQFDTVALQDSDVMLGDNANQVAISSGYTSLRTSSPEGNLDLSGSLNAVGVANSRISTGGGDDQVWVATPMPILEGLGPIGLLGSTVDLGEGDDLLAVEGAVIGSTIRPGGGNNRILLEGGVQDSAIMLHPESTTSVALGSLADVLTLDTGGPAWIHLGLGGGADALQFASPFFRGSIDGGVGEDRFLFGWGAAPTPTPATGLASAFPSGAAAAGPLQISGGADRDLFLFSRPDAFTEVLGWKPQLMDLSLALDGEGGIGLTDRIGWSGATIEELTPADSLGLGNPSLLPIAPLGLLLEGIRAGRASVDQLAIALTDRGGELMMIRGDGRTHSLVDLPDLRI